MPELSQPLLGFHDKAFYRGSTARTRATSESGALKALEGRQQKIDTLRCLWTQPRTLQELASITGYALGSVCSLKKCLLPELEEVDAVEKYWPDGKVTTRTRWQLKVTT